LLALCGVAKAGEVSITQVRFVEERAGSWRVHVTLRHADSGWDHYADEWRVVDEAGHPLGKRVLLHPHVNEQPFTRSLSGVRTPEGVSVVYVTAHDTVHGWSSDRVKIDLSESSGPRFRVERLSR